MNQVEAAFKASIAPTDAPNDAPKQKKTRQSGKPARKEHPLFDINPRIAWEFIERAQSEKGISGVMFQQENEVFTQWKREEEERVAKAETPLPPPSSFADALQRKSAINEEREIAKSMQYLLFL